MSAPVTILGQPHAADGSGYYRFYQPYKHLARGSDLRILLPEAGTKFTPNDEQIAEVDVVVGQRFCGPDGIALWQRWKGHTALVYEVDDDVLHPDSWSGLAHMFDPFVHDSFKVCIAASDMVTASTEPLADVMRRYNPNVRVIPNHIEADMLYLDRTRREQLVVGWAGGMSHLADWVHIADPVGTVLRSNPDIDVHFCGIDYSPVLRLDRPTRYSAWKPDVWSYFKQIDFDIGLAPLASTPFNDCKSHIRALEYMALGIPVVASDCPAYRDLIVDGVTGFLVRSEDEWQARLTDLVNDEAMRTEMGAKGREVAAGWTIQQGWKLWRDAYEDVARMPLAPMTIIPVAGLTDLEKANVAEWRRLFQEQPGERPHHRGIDCQQFAADLDRYTELVADLKPPFIVEIGRANAGTALYLADELAKVVPDGQVISIDIMGPQPAHENITYIEGSSTSPLVFEAVRELAAGRRGLVLIDGEHSSAQVARELAVYADMADYLIVEDTIVEHLGWSDGPHIALVGWLMGHPEFTVDLDPAPTQHPGGWVRRTTQENT